MTTEEKQEREVGQGKSEAKKGVLPKVPLRRLAALTWLVMEEMLTGEEVCGAWLGDMWVTSLENSDRRRR